ncbi:MAG: type II secretion system F family protein [Candidatus Omnitrophica bacterium]|nr:type II secretion system F family protein [Candidatus Omnitrophota bacterium]
MPRFTYTARSSPQRSVSGDLEADSKQDAINKLTRLGYFPVRIEAEDLSATKTGLLKLRLVKNREIALFTHQLSTLLESGVNILSGLNIIAGQASNRYFKSVINDIIAKIRDGRAFSESLALHPDIFSSLYTSMIRAGEASGTLDETLKRLAEFLEKDEEFRSSVRSALTYPAFVFGVGCLTVAVLLGFVIPRLVTMFEDMGQALPLPTKILIGISGTLRSYWWLILIILATAAFLFRRALRSPEGKLAWDAFKLKTPVWGQISLKTEISRMMRTLSLLLSSGVAIVSSLDIASAVLENQVLKDEMRKFKDEISKGASFSRCLNDSKAFPVFVTDIVKVGEETGSLEKALMRIADDYGRDVDQSLKNLSRLLEPVIIVIMGLIVGYIVLSMLLPIFQINLIVR